MFKRNGYEDTSFIAGMCEGEMVSIGVTQKAHVTAMMTAIADLPEWEPMPGVPVTNNMTYFVDFVHKNLFSVHTIFERTLM